MVFKTGMNPFINLEAKSHDTKAVGVFLKPHEGFFSNRLEFTENYSDINFFLLIS